MTIHARRLPISAPPIAAALACLLLATSVRSQDAGKPILALDAGGHTNNVRTVLFSKDGKELISVSVDGTIRFWNAQSGESLRVLRPLYLPGGSIGGAALSPDGKTLAVARGGTKSTEQFVFLIDAASGRIRRVFPAEHTTLIHRLRFSPDGTALASGAFSDGVARLWNVATGERMQIFRGHTNSVRGLAFSPDGKRLVTSSGDQTARVWSIADGSTEAILMDTEKQAFTANCVAVSPDGKSIVTGHFGNGVRVWNWDGTLRSRLASNQAAHDICFTSDPNKLVVVGSMPTMLDLTTGDVVERFDAPQALWSCALSPDGKTLAAAGDGGDVNLYAIDGSTGLRQLSGKGKSIWGVGWSKDGRSVSFGNTLGDFRGWGELPDDNETHPLERTFSFRDLELSGKPAAKTIRYVLEDGSFSMRRNANTGRMTVLRDSAPAATMSVQFQTGFTFLKDNRVVLCGANGLGMYDARNGELLHAFPGAYPTYEVCASADGRYLLSGGSDQVARIWLPQKAELLLSLFVADSEWVAWTPEGYYACSPGGEQLIGWQVNNGLDKMASFFPAAQFRRTLYRPDVIKHLLECGSVDAALDVAGKELGKASVRTSVAQVLPPFILITSPDQPKVDVSDPKIQIRYVAKPVGNNPITAVRLMVNGRPYPGAEGLKTFAAPIKKEIRDSWTIPLAPGSNVFAVQVESDVSKSLSEPVEVTFSQARGAVRDDDKQKPPREFLPSLYVLSIGVSDYPGNLKLGYAAKDAQVLAKTLIATSSSLFEKVEVKQIVDKEATRRNILQGFTWLKKQMTQNDVAIITFAGHGNKDSDGRLYLLPIDVDVEDLVSSAVPSDQVKNLLSTTPGRIVMMLDACHSGAVDGPARRGGGGGGLTDDLVRDLVSDDYGLVVMCSSTGREFSLESAETAHGFFTLAVVEGLGGKADYDKVGVVTLNDLDRYVTNRVKELSKGRQHPVTTRPATLRSFPLSRPTRMQTRLDGLRQFDHGTVVRNTPNLPERSPMK
jgi:WD40 repeat protein